MNNFFLNKWNKQTGEKHNFKYQKILTSSEHSTLKGFLIKTMTENPDVVSQLELK